MDELTLVSGAELKDLRQTAGGLAPISAYEMDTHAPDEHWVVTGGNAVIRARCSIWWQSTPEMPEERPGVIGHYAALDEAGSSRLLEHACERLRQRGCTLAVGPMDGSTWRSYRLLTERGSEPVFFLEPDNPDSWPSYFLAAGFSPLAGYSSALNNDLTKSDRRAEAAADRLLRKGVRIREFDPGDAQAELRRILEVCLKSFRRNFLYTPIAEAEFMDIYGRILPFLVPGLVYMAESEDRPVGFLFAIPDILQQSRDGRIDTLVIKSLAVVPGRDNAGLGSLLMAKAHKKAHELGYRRAINALMHDANNSCNISRRYAGPFRRYALYFRRLAK